MKPSITSTPILKYSLDVARAWCQENGWSDLFIEQYRLWAFPPGGVMPLPLPECALEEITFNPELGPREILSQALVFTAAVGSILTSFATHSPVVLVVGFAACAIAVGLGEP